MISYRTLLLVGGESAKDQIKALSEGVDVVIGTPGRLEDLISTGKLDLASVCIGESPLCITVLLNTQFLCVYICLYVREWAAMYMYNVNEIRIYE